MAEVDAYVRDALIAWSSEPDPDVGARMLGETYRVLSPELAEGLLFELAAVSAASLVDMLARDSDSGSPDASEPAGEREPIEIDGIAVDPMQIERIAAWRGDQERLITAIGIDPEAWGLLLGNGFVTLKHSMLDAEDKVAERAIRLVGQVAPSTTTNGLRHLRRLSPAFRSLVDQMVNGRTIERIRLLAADAVELPKLFPHVRSFLDLKREDMKRIWVSLADQVVSFWVEDREIATVPLDALRSTMSVGPEVASGNHRTQ